MSRPFDRHRKWIAKNVYKLQVISIRNSIVTQQYVLFSPHFAQFYRVDTNRVYA